MNTNTQSISNEFTARSVADPTLADRIVARIGTQPKRDAIGATLLRLAMDEIDGHVLAGPALDAMKGFCNAE